MAEKKKYCPKCRRQYSADDQLVFCLEDGEPLLEGKGQYVGTLVGEKYLLSEELGAGGWGTVYLSKHQVLGVPFAVKLLSPRLCQNLGDIARFENEAMTLAKLDHEGIVKVLDFGLKPSPYIVMQYIEGKLLTEILDHGPLPELKLTAIARNLFAVLEYAHNLGIVHRDIKPRNIMVQGYESKSPNVKLLDFGIATLLEDDPKAGQRTNELLGSLPYMSPEQFEGKISTASDIYALGCVLFECVLGRPPFRSQGFAAWKTSHCDETPAMKPQDANISATHRELLKLTLQCLAKDPDQRPTAKQAREQLEKLMHTLVLAPRTTSVKDRVLTAVITVLAIAGIGGGAFWYIKSQEASSDPRVLQEAARKSLAKNLLPVADSVGVKSEKTDDESVVIHPQAEPSKAVYVFRNLRGTTLALNAMCESWSAAGAVVICPHLDAPIGSTQDMEAALAKAEQLAADQKVPGTVKAALVFVEQPLEPIMEGCAKLQPGSQKEGTPAIAALVLIDPKSTMGQTLDSKLLHNINLPIFSVLESNLRGAPRGDALKKCEEAFTFAAGKQILYNSQRVSLKNTTKPNSDQEVLRALLLGFFEGVLLEDRAKELYLFSQKSVQAVGSSASLKMR